MRALSAVACFLVACGIGFSVARKSAPTLRSKSQRHLPPSLPTRKKCELKFARSKMCCPRFLIAERLSFYWRGDTRTSAKYKQLGGGALVRAFLGIPCLAVDIEKQLFYMGKFVSIFQ